jgi:hypothetical protein
MANITGRNRRLAGATVLMATALAVAGCGGQTGSAAQSPAPAGSAAATASPSPSSTVSGRATASASAANATVSAVAPGFPSQTLPLMPGATALATSFDASASPAVASLVAGSSSASASEMLDYYTKTLTGEGFTAVPAASASSSTSASMAAAGTLVRDFVRSNGSETATVTVVTANKQAVATVGVSVAPSSLK